MFTDELTLAKDCPATLIPAGDKVVLPEGTTLVVTQTLGGSITVRARGGLYRIEGADALATMGLDVSSEDSSNDAAQPSDTFSEERVYATLKGCFDPEIPVNIVDLGLIYDCRLHPQDDGRFVVEVKMTLTAQGCGMGPTIAGDARQKLESLPEVSKAEVSIVWDPVWTPQMISEEGRRILGL